MSYLARARERTRRRRSPWNLLVFAIWLPSWIAVWWLGLRLGWWIHVLVYREHRPFWSIMMNAKHRDLLRFLGSMLMLFGPLLPALIASAIVANFVTHLVKPARVALDREARNHRGTDYATVQRSFLRVLKPVAAVGFLLLVAGALVPFKLP